MGNNREVANKAIGKIICNGTRKIVAYWDGQPVHRPLTIEEKMRLNGIDPTVGALGMAILGSKNILLKSNQK